MPTQDTGETATGDNTDASAHLLHRNHEREADGNQPKQTVAKLGTGDAVGSDSRRIVVRRAGDESGSQFAPPRKGVSSSLRFSSIVLYDMPKGTFVAIKRTYCLVAMEQCKVRGRDREVCL